ncbi:MAG: type VI secretion system baseplate subunit TssE [Methylococcaceae bacterium]
MAQNRIIHGSFFERLDSKLPQTRSVDDSNHLSRTVDSVKNNLQWMLNSRQGCSQSAPDLGLDDFNDSVGGITDFTIKISHNIKQTIKQYEPRIKIHAVNFVPNKDDPMKLSFRIEGTLLIKYQKKDVLIELVLNGLNKHYKIY